jgi:hypothetical protein
MGSRFHWLSPGPYLPNETGPEASGILFFPKHAQDAVPFEISGALVGVKLRISVIDRRETRVLGSISMERGFSAPVIQGVYAI